MLGLSDLLGGEVSLSERLKGRPPLRAAGSAEILPSSSTKPVRPSSRPCPKIFRA
jgi:hypothetical protein